MSSQDNFITVVIGGTGRSGHSLVGNMLGNWEDALYLPVEIRLRKLCFPSDGNQVGRVRAFVDGLADHLDRGRLAPSSLGEVHEVRGFHGDIFRNSFFEVLAQHASPASILRAFVHAMRESRDQGKEARIAVVESPGSEFLFSELVAAGLDLRCIQMIRPLLDVYASHKGKYLRTYYPSLRHSENLLQQIVMGWRESVIRASWNVETLERGRVRAVNFDEGKRCSDSFRERLADFIFPLNGESRTRLRAHLDAVARGRDILRGPFVVAQNRSPISGRSEARYSHLAGWEVDLCQVYDPWFREAQMCSERATGVLEHPPGRRLTVKLMALIARAAVVGPRLDRQILHARDGLRLRRLGVETALDTVRWMTGRLQSTSA